VFFWSLFIIHTRVNVSLSPVLALAPCPPVLTFPYRILLCFLFVLLFLLLTRKLTFRDKSPMLYLFFSSSSSCRRNDRVEVTSLSEHLSQMAAFASNAGGYRKPLPTCRSCMTPRKKVLGPNEMASPPPVVGPTYSRPRDLIWLLSVFNRVKVCWLSFGVLVSYPWLIKSKERKKEYRCLHFWEYL